MTLMKQKCVLKHFFGTVALSMVQQDAYKGMLLRSPYC